MKRFLVLFLIALPQFTLAGECDRWSASMQEDEGGPVMTARICHGVPTSDYELFVTCGNPGELWMRLLPVTPAESQPASDYTTDFKLSFGNEVVTRKAHYEEMDGAMVLDFRIDAPLTGLIQNGTGMTVADVTGKVAGATFTLKGAKSALKTLIQTCTK